MTRKRKKQGESLRETRKDHRGIVKREFIETPWGIDILKRLCMKVKNMKKLRQRDPQLIRLCDTVLIDFTVDR